MGNFLKMELVGGFEHQFFILSIDWVPNHPN